MTGLRESIIFLATSVAIATVTTTTTTASATGRQLTHRYLGCHVEGPGGNRDLIGMKHLTKLGPYPISAPSDGLTSIAAMTVDLCSRICSLGGFAYFGVQFSTYCGCDSSYGSFGPADEASCSSPCGGNASQVCGNAYRNSMYRIDYGYTDYFHLIANASSLVVQENPANSADTSRLGAATTLPTCLLECQSSGWCQAAWLTGEPGSCHLLRFGAVPTALVTGQGQLWTRK